MSMHRRPGQRQTEFSKEQSDAVFLTLNTAYIAKQKNVPFATLFLTKSIEFDFFFSKPHLSLSNWSLNIKIKYNLLFIVKYI